jgi:SAM-dependent methyltransferase
MMNVCKICGNERNNRFHHVREMAFGIRDQFMYLECGDCGCLQILEVPADLGKYYPQGYYSLEQHGFLKTFVRRRWSAHAFGQRNLLGWIISELFFPNRAMQAVWRAKPGKDARILDIGCGCGRLLLDLSYLGFRNVSGIDPFLPADLRYANGVAVSKKQLSELDGPFDLIMLHHSFEHMDRPMEVMRQISERLSPRGQVILAIPVASSFAWRHYGVNWGNLDAPRHLFLHTKKSIERMAQLHDFEIEQTVYEGDDGQFWLSEQYAKEIPLHDPRSINLNVMKRLSAWRSLRAYKARAKELNLSQEGDLACFHLRRTH